MDIQSGNFVWSPGTDWQAPTSGTTSPGSGRLYVVPFTVHRPMAFDRININAATGEFGKVVRLVLYDSLETGHPGSVLYQSADLSVAANGVKSDTLYMGLETNQYWIGFVSDVTSATFTALDKDHVRRIGTSSTFGSEAATHLRYNISWTAGTALTDYPTSPNQVTSDPPMLGFRVA